ncbi:MAG TPA: amino acid deaminase/aldolase [Solirubrobacteraceae bacterium]|jgi:D-serine deaminase-like pyridoxal phosphate-dependent protein|nr:amino acid deaminase/aldolase [Solirubrobacteraceae bacterium]
MSDAAYARLERATAGLQAPFALVDLDALWANAADMERRAARKPIRLASKSLRCRSLQERVLARDGFTGTLAFTLPEGLWLAAHGTDDILVAYPTADRDALCALARNGADGGERDRPLAERVTLMVDCVEQLELIERAARAPNDAPPDARLRVCIDIDTGWRALAGRVRIGARRSPLRTPEQAAALASAILVRDGLRLVGIMAYEAQIAGVGDAPGSRGIGPSLRARAIQAMQARSGRELAPRRAAIVAAVERVIDAHGAPPLELVNGGGTGSLERTAAEHAVTEVAAGSGLYGPTLFDAYRAFTPRPAALFALPVVRRPGRGVVTALGGGYLASGRADAARLPAPYLPAGLTLDRQEGAGEVQTPMLGPAADALGIGDRVYLRHAKAGELCERFASLHLLEGERIVDEVPTYRGEGQCFL